LRDDSESVTLGGGIVLDAHAPRTAKTSFSRLTYLAAMESGTVGGILQTLLIDHQQIMDLSRFKKSWNLRDDELNRALLEPALAEKIRLFDVAKAEFAVARHVWDSAGQILSKNLSDWHKEKPKETGIGLSELKARLAPGLEPTLFKAVVLAQQERGVFKISNGLVSASDHQSVISDEVEQQWTGIEKAMAKHGTNIPMLSNLQRDIAFDESSVVRVLHAAARSGKVIRLAERRFALPSVLRVLAESVCELACKSPQFSIIEFKNHAGLGRNLTMELLEYFDSIRFTKRNGDKRSVIDAELPGRYFKSM